MTPIKVGDKVRVCNTDSDADGRIGAVSSLGEWCGRPVVTVLFDGAKWDEPEIDQFYLSEVEPIERV